MRVSSSRFKSCCVQIVNSLQTIRFHTRMKSIDTCLGNIGLSCKWIWAKLIHKPFKRGNLWSPFTIYGCCFFFTSHPFPLTRDVMFIDVYTFDEEKKRTTEERRLYSENSSFCPGSNILHWLPFKNLSTCSFTAVQADLISLQFDALSPPLLLATPLSGFYGWLRMVCACGGEADRQRSLHVVAWRSSASTFRPASTRSLLLLVEDFNC